MTRVLIADDIQQNLYLLESILKGCSYEVIPAKNHPGKKRCRST